MSARSKLRRQPGPAPRSRGGLVILGLLTAIGLLGLWQWWRTWDVSSADVAPSPAVTSAPPLAALGDSPYLESMRNATYVGSQACIECHEGQHASYLQTAHSRSFGPVDLAAEPPDGQFARAGTAWRYQSYRADGQLRHREFLTTESGEVTLVDRPLKYMVGSGRFSRTYLAEVDGILVESPVTWYASLNAWNLSPGFQKGPYNSFSRNISADCLYCHVGRADFPPESENRPQFHELAISCERCHGPGSEHVALRREKADVAPGQDLTIVHPERLPRELSESICHQCHLETDSSALVRGRRREDFRPGLRWTDFVVNYARDTAETGMTVTGHVQQMHLSRCYQQSEKLTCVTCHDPHRPPKLEERVASYRSVCLECHRDEACGLASPARVEKNQNDCAACHMPQAATDIAHVAFTHHRIGIHPDQTAPPRDDAPQLAPVLDVSHLGAADRERTLGLAYARMIAQHEQDARYQALWSKAEGHLQRSAERHLRDASVETALAVIAGRRGDARSARAGAEAALADPRISPAERAVATNLLAGLELDAGHLDASHRLLQQLTRWRLMPSDWFLLGTCRQRMGDRAGAIAAFEKVLQIDATEPATYRTLAALYQADGKPERAKELLERAALLEEHLANLPN